MSSNLDRRLRTTLFWRSLSLQASWNHQRMQNLGLLTIMMPWLRRQPRRVSDDRLFCRRYYDYFNTNPYLANFLIGGLVRLETDRVSGLAVPPGMSTKFKDSLGRAFASLGDQLFWMGVQPSLIMGISLAAMGGRITLIPLVIGMAAVFQLVLRWWSLERGYRSGMDILDLLQHPAWHIAIAMTRRLGLVLTGVVGGLLWSRAHSGTQEKAELLVWVGLGVGFALPQVLRKRFPGEILVLVAVLLSLGMAFAIRVSGG